MRQTVIELMPDEEYETVEGRCGRVLSASALDIAFYGEGEKRRGKFLDEAQYRVGQCVGRDMERLRGIGGGSWLARIRESEAFVAIPSSTRMQTDPFSRAACNLLACADAVGADAAMCVLGEFVRDGYNPTDLARRWKMRKERAKATIVMALDRIIGVSVYEQRQWTDAAVWALREAAA